MKRGQLKLGVIDAISAAPMTSKELAARLGTTRKSVNHQLTLLNRSGILRREGQGGYGGHKPDYRYSIERRAVTGRSMPAIPPHLETSPIAVSALKNPRGSYPTRGFLTTSPGKVT